MMRHAFTMKKKLIRSFVGTHLFVNISVSHQTLSYAEEIASETVRPMRNRTYEPSNFVLSLWIAHVCIFLRYFSYWLVERNARASLNEIHASKALWISDPQDSKNRSFPVSPEYLALPDDSSQRFLFVSSLLLHSSFSFRHGGGSAHIFTRNQ